MYSNLFFRLRLVIFLSCTLYIFVFYSCSLLVLWGTNSKLFSFSSFIFIQVCYFSCLRALVLWLYVIYIHVSNSIQSPLTRWKLRYNRAPLYLRCLSDSFSLEKRHCVFKRLIGINVRISLSVSNLFQWPVHHSRASVHCTPDAPKHPLILHVTVI